jgi:hypothetical protein
VSNPGPEPVRVLVVSTMHLPDIAEHVDTGATMPITAPGAARVFPRASDVPVLDAVLSAMAANGAVSDAGG